MKKGSILFRSVLVSLILLCTSCSSMQGIHNIRTDALNDGTGSKQSLKLMTYNIRAGCGLDNYGMSPYKCSSSKEKLNKVVDALIFVDPDVITLQEVRGFSQAEYIAERLNMNFTYNTHKPNNSWWGLATLSRSKILVSESRYIHSGKNSRSALVCQIDHFGKIITVVNVHFHIGSFESQVSRTVGIMKKLQPPKILMGDLNISYGDFKLEPVNDILQDTCIAIDTGRAREIRYRGTWHYPGKRIDYVFVDPDSFVVKEVDLVLGQHYFASDHIGYYAVVDLK